MDIRYQVVVLDPGETGRSERLRDTLRRRLADLGLDPEQAVSFLEASNFESRTPNAPVVGIYFGSEVKKDAETEVIGQLLSLPAVVLPVVESIEKYQSLVPDALGPVNGIALDPQDSELEQVANLALEALSLLRQSRRLFISYKRLDSRSVALQLYELLDERGYDVFLDTHGVLPGEPFQDVLWHRLADSDITILIDTPNFLGSQWTQQELAEASAMSIGILQVVWPDHKRAPTTTLAIPFYLEKTHFIDPGQGNPSEAKLSSEILARIAVEVERLRARSLAARHDNIVREFHVAAQAAGVDTTIQPYRYIIATKDSKKVAIIPAVGVPTALQIQEIESKLDPAVLSGVSQGFLVYDHRGIRDRWLSHLDWLDRHLPIKTFRVTDASRWLNAL
jgi:TIR domain-containing protein